MPRRHPQRPLAVLDHQRDELVTEPLRDPERLVPPTASAKESVRRCADPEIAATVDQQAGDAAARRTLVLTEAPEASVFVDRQAVGVRADPHAAVAILREAREDAVSHAVRRTKAARETAVPVVMQAADGRANPEDAVAVFKEASNVRIGESILRTEMFHPPVMPAEQPAIAGADPERAVARRPKHGRAAVFRVFPNRG